MFVRSYFQTGDEDTAVDVSQDASFNETMEPGNAVEESPENPAENNITNVQDSITGSVITSSVPSTIKMPFYARWWFTLIFLIPVLFGMRRIYLVRERKLNAIIKNDKDEIDKMKIQLFEKEVNFESTQKEQSDILDTEKELRYQAEGISKFSDILSKNKSNVNILGQKIISELVSFVGANSGAIYLLRDGEGKEPNLEFFGGFAPDLKQIDSSFKVGEGYVGACFKDGITMELDNAQESYIKVYSGLGESKPGYLVFVPLKQDELKLGVIEIASFHKLDEFKIKFIENLSENIASTLAINQANEKMQIMLKQSEIQAKELQTREEELRQNLEEMHATQEDLNRQIEKNKKMQESLIKEKALLDSLMNSLPDYIYFKDLKSKFIRISKSMLPLFPVNDVDEMIGKSDSDFQEKETALKYYEEEMNIIKTGKGFIDQISHEVMENGFEQWVSTSKMPLFDETGKCIGTFGITKNISDLKKLELDSKERAEQLLAQEEELRQNLEEMQAVQDELHRQKDELSREKALMDALLGNVEESIYFKDEKSRFIKASNSMAKLFKVKGVEELYGKSDFDFFTDEHARPAFEDEMNIIRSGKPMLDKIEKETHADGRVSWVNTSKMPLRNSAGKIIGTFGISKDITETKKMEMEIKEKNEALQAQEEELRQNLEEMQATQDELERQMAENKKVQEELEKEMYLMDALMDNVPEYIYFKDPESKFIKSSKSLAQAFGFSDASMIVGKTDFDYFAEEHARPAYNDEQKIIKTGKPILNFVEKEVKKDGSVTWVSTSKMPLRDQKGKIVGTFGISKDITDIKKMEMEIKEKNEELQAQEEELRQNLEEMQTTQEDLERQITENKKVQEKLEKEMYLMDALMDNVPEYIYFKDLESRFIKNSKSHARVFGYSDAKDIMGKSDFDFFTDEHARPAFEDEQKIIKTGKPIINLVEKEVKKDGSVTWVSTSKMPLRDQKGKIVGTFGISKDITDIKKMEMEIKEKNEELQAQEEELRQNLEEMQTTQEDLERQITENKKVQEKLEKEMYLMDALMDNVPEYIYFKDLESRFIKNSKSHARVFGYSDAKDIMGKSDFDFFSEEHARPAFEDEQKIIKTGKSIINLVEKEVKKDGSVTWVSTSKMPLRDQKGKTVGTFGISKDITDIKNMEFEINKRLEENEKIKKEYKEKESAYKNTIQKLQQELKK